MKPARFFIIICLLWLWAAPAALADGDIPPSGVPSPAAAPQPTSSADGPGSPITQPTAPPAATVMPPTVPPEPAGSPISVTGENPAHQIAQPTAPPAPSGSPSGTNPSSPGAGAPSTGQSGAGMPGAPGNSTGVTLPPAPGDSGISGITSAGVNGIGDISASAPAQLQCNNRTTSPSGPFMVSPYAGWASVNSFLDHDNPDYAVDGTIVIANGLRATASDGQESDLFPAYWSPSLRQYVNYDGHNGYDFGISYQPVLAAAAGTVMYAGWNGPDQYSGYGQMVLINHHNGYVTLYGHLSSLSVSKGDHVKAGEQIGISGSTGHSSGPHLHFSVFHDCNVVDPYGWSGSGHDPLTSFDGERSGYLWLPGQDPLILNPPPHWPAYPAGLRPVIQTGIGPGALGSRSLPPADRLLLLDLPAPSRDRVDPGTALARTESRMTQEAQALTPYLDQFEAGGLLQSYQIIPEAAAVWVRGTADAGQLEALPGVASLSGVQPRDVEAAEAGLAHSVLIQLDPQQAPSLWPVGFRSALHPWRPIITVVNRHALVEGFALPGDDVTVSLHRAGQVPGAAQATGDPDTGGFVAMLHDASGRPLAVKPGDRVEVTSGGRRTSLTVSVFKLRARPKSLSGIAPPNATVALAVLDPSGTERWKTVTTASPSGRFGVPFPQRRQSGTLAVATAVNAAGNLESAAGYIPGMVVDRTSSVVQGWTVASRPTLQLWRSGREIFQKSLRPAPDGSFRLTLRKAGAVIGLRAGDVLSIGSTWHRHRLVLSHFDVRMSTATASFSITGPPFGQASVNLERNGSVTPTLIHLNGAGHASLPATNTAIGDRATATMSTRGGDRITATVYVSGMVVHVGTARVTGQVEPYSGVRVGLRSNSGRRLGAAAVTAGLAGAFSVRVADRGRRVRVQPGMQVTLDDGLNSVRVHVPKLSATVTNQRVLIQSAPSARLALTWVTHGRDTVRRVQASSRGVTIIPSERARGANKLLVAVSPSVGIRVQRWVSLSRLTASCKRRAGGTCIRRTHRR